MLDPLRPRAHGARLRQLAVLSLIGVCVLWTAGCGDNKLVPGMGKQRAGAAMPGALEAPGVDKPHNTEAYDHIVDNPFRLAAQEPLSTFSADVDTASYSNMRRFLLTERKLPPKDAVRIEEMINYFTYDYPSPSGEHPVAIAPELTACPWDAKHRLLRIGVQTKKIDPTQLPPRNLVFLLDTSGSMDAPNRLPLLIESLKLLVEQLTEKDKVTIVAYAGSAGLVLAPTNGGDHRAINRALSRLSAGGSTNGGEGIELAYRMARQSFIDGGVNRVIIGTDGDFNVGVTNQGDLIRMIEEKRKSGVFLTILGFGMGNLKDSTMEKLAHYGNGHYAYIDDLDEAKKLFIEQGAALVTVAKDVKFQVEFNPKHVGAYRLIGYENRILAHQDFNNDQKDAGDLGSGHTVTALYELVPAGEKFDLPGIDPLTYQEVAKKSAAASGDEWLTIKLRYKDPEAETSKLLSVPVRARDFNERPTIDAEFAAAVAGFGMLLRDSPYKGKATFGLIQALAERSRGADMHGHRAEFAKLVDAAAQMKRTD
jgi:Ca-activated chloride channel family protein